MNRLGPRASTRLQQAQFARADPLIWFDNCRAQASAAAVNALGAHRESLVERVLTTFGSIGGRSLCSSRGSVRLLLNARAHWSRASMLRAALLLRARELETGGDPAQLPASLEELATRYQAAPLLDYLGETSRTLLLYEANRETGEFTIRHRPNLQTYEGEEGGELRGRWTRTAPADTVTTAASPATS